MPHPAAVHSWKINNGFIFARYFNGGYWTPRPCHYDGDTLCRPTH